jgi:glycogen debranching enzyme
VTGKLGAVPDEPSPYVGTTPVAALTDQRGPITLVEGQTFALSDVSGDICPDLPHGLFVLDTRVLSQWELRVNGHRLEPLAVEVSQPYAAVFAGRGHAARGRADADLVVFRHRHIGWGMRERIVVTNHGLEPSPLVVEAFCDVDFANLFEVKERRVPEARRRSLHMDPTALRFENTAPHAGRNATIRLADPASVEPGLAVWRTTLAPGETWQTCVEFVTVLDGSAVEPRFGCGRDDADALPTQRLERWRATVPSIVTDAPAFDSAIRRSGEDLGALRIFDPAHPDVPVIAAGAPWFMTVFGRDSLLTGWMTLLADHSLAHGVLRTLARFQGEDVDDRTEEEPGKILHEMRFATAGGHGLDRGEIYYGSIDATPLFIVLLAELRRWNPSSELADALLPHADKALEWIATFGDRDGDGYVEYQRRTDQGLANQGWKDSWDAVRHADGSLAEAPIALCEVQGYVYAAYIARAHLAREAGDASTSQRYVELARDLRRRFNEDFWLDELGTYALGLDAHKRPIAAVASNAGHCLWTGIADPDKAALVADRLLEQTMFSGWGVRTLDASMPAYNPVSYHNGSVWPHDNAICAAGLARYGFDGHANRIIAAQLEAAAAHHGRLPELFAGFDRDELAVPAAYPTSCSPQAWAAASPVLWLRTMLGLDPWVSRRQLWLEPRLPESIHRMHITGIDVAGQKLTIEIEGDHVEVSGLSGWEVIRSPRPPLTDLFSDDTT